VVAVALTVSTSRIDIFHPEIVSSCPTIGQGKISQPRQLFRPAFATARAPHLSRIDVAKQSHGDDL
jgi:hypothetical protein